MTDLIAGLMVAVTPRPLWGHASLFFWKVSVRYDPTRLGSLS